MCFFDDEDDGAVFSRSEGSAPIDLTMNTPDGNVDGQKQLLTARSKHSATEQRRRSKINDRFQMLKDLLPQSDQKRDKASFLLEVVEYVKFLQEKVMRYEAFPGWSQENTKLNPRKSIMDHPDGTSAAGYMFSGKFDDNIPVAELNADCSYKMAEIPGLVTKDCHPEWLRSGPADCTMNSSSLNEQEELTIDEGTVSVSAAYSQELLMALSQGLQISGIDLSQASIAVQINLGRRAIRPVAATTILNDKDHDPSSSARAMEHSSAGSSGED